MDTGGVASLPQDARSGYISDGQQTPRDFGGWKKSLDKEITPKPFAKLVIHSCNIFLFFRNGLFI